MLGKDFITSLKKTAALPPRPEGRGFRAVKRMKKLGSGWPTIFSSYVEKKLKPPRLIEGKNFIKCILSRELDDTQEQECSLLNLFFSSSQITILDVMHYLNTSRTTAGRQLNELVKQGKIKKTGKGRGTYYTK